MSGFDQRYSLSGIQIPGMIEAVTPDPTMTAFPIVDTILLDNLPMAGKWTLTRCTKKFGWVQQKGSFLTGATVLPDGDPLISAEFRVEFWTNADWQAFQAYRGRLIIKPAFQLGITTAAIPIKHPELSILGVENVLVEEVSAFIQEEPGLWVGSVKFLQYRPPIPAIKKPSQAIPGVAPNVPTARSAQELELQKQQAEFNTLQTRFLAGP